MAAKCANCDHPRHTHEPLFEDAGSCDVSGCACDGYANRVIQFPQAPAPRGPALAWGFTAVLLGAVALTILVVFTACEPAPERSPDPETGWSGTWHKIEPPPDAPEGTTCFIWKSGWGGGIFGGPYCRTPEVGCSQ